MSKIFAEKIDLSQFHETFFQESLEGLSAMENGLLSLSHAVGESIDPETIHDVFRAAHSIKGGSATFGFEEVTNLTHLLETILDLMREGQCESQAAANEVLLRAVDSVRELINARLTKRDPDLAMVDRVSRELSEMLAASQTASQNGSAAPAHGDSPTVALEKKRFPDLEISFHPHIDIFQSANDPLQYLAEVAHLGEMASKADISHLPHLAELDTSNCYLTWEITLNHPKAGVGAAKEVFLWIEDRSDLEISEVVMAETVISEVALAEAVVKQSPEIKAAAEMVVKEEVPKASESKSPESKSPESKAGAARASKEASSIRVSTEKVDAVVNLVGELVITQSMLNCIGDDFQITQLTKLREGLAQLTRNTRELQETVLKMRMLPIGNLFDRFPRVVHDLSRKLNKSIGLKITGEQTEMDRTLLEKLSDPLVHLVRNSLDHGIELPEVRRAIGKPEQGTVHLHAEHKGGNIVIEISDDGAGLNAEKILARARERGIVSETDVLDEAAIYALIFEPGFSTAEAVTEVSGRGVGMDVVRRNVQELGGQVHLTSRFGLGTVSTIMLPLTLAILDGQLMRVGEQRFVLPLESIIESVQVKKSELRSIVEDVELYHWRDDYLRVVRLHKLFNVAGKPEVAEKGLLIIVESRGDRIALSVDDLLAQQQVVIKSLETNYQKVQGVAGATILGDGAVAMILDVTEIMERSKETAVGQLN